MQVNSINSTNECNSNNKYITNNEINILRHDLLLFKNEILKDMREEREKLYIELKEKMLTNTEQFDVYDKKLEILFNQIEQINSFKINFSDLIEKLNSFKLYQTKIENHINNLKTKINMFQKEYKEYIITTENLINENLKYPGIIGRNGKFNNFRYFIDYVIKSFKDLYDFKEDIKNFDFKEFEKKINSEIKEFRKIINDSHRNTLNLIEHNIVESNSKIADIIIKNQQIISENENKFLNFKNIINCNLLEYQTKFIELEKKINDKYNDQLNEVESIKRIKSEFINEINKINSKFENYKSQFESLNYTIGKNNYMKSINNNIISENKKVTEEKYRSENNSNNLLSEDNRESNLILKQKNMKSGFDNKSNYNYNKIVSFSDNNIDSTERIKSNNGQVVIDSDRRSFSNEIRNNIQNINKSNSFEKIPYINGDNNNFQKINENFEIYDKENINNKENIAFIYSVDKKKSIANDSNKYGNLIKIKNTKNNYSISNIANIKLKQVSLPESLNTRNRKILERNNRSIILSNDKTFSQTKNHFFKDINNKMNKNGLLDLKKIMRNKCKKIKFINSARTFQRKEDSKINENLNLDPLKIVKYKNNNLKNLSCSRKRKCMNISYERNKEIINKEKNNKSIQLMFRKTFYEKNKIKEI